MKYLKKKSVQIDGNDIAIRQLSGLERFEFFEFLSSLEEPAIPIRPRGDELSEKQQKDYQDALQASEFAWKKITYLGQSRLVAYGLVDDDLSDDIDKRHETVKQWFSDTAIAQLHDEIALLSGMTIELDDSDVSTDPKEGETSDVSMDPKP
ncbi:phage minor tail protein domain-containing protein [Vibrio vulnificus]|uniref:phage minor tail protein domain-containing protein n=1 Tax=Vibrio vulnificus TaxID=672 RepID=UPI001A1E293D|nr:hypothetical protein [Vibrio vulnificus]HDY7642421.1 hypothetical protein [Vibrio vulnificus]